MANSTNKALYFVASDICTLANQRFGLSQGMMMLMRGSLISSTNKEKIVSLAKHREFEKLEILLNELTQK